MSGAIETVHPTGARGALRWLWLAAAVVAADQLTKWLAAHYLPYATPVPLTPFLNLTLVHNTGAAFSFLSTASGWQRWLFTGLAAGVSGVIVAWLRRLPAQARWQAAALALVLGGALGNLIDRVVHGYVVDFIDFHYLQWHFPAFNLADSAITVGAALLVVDLLRTGNR